MTDNNELVFIKIFDIELIKSYYVVNDKDVNISHY